MGCSVVITAASGTLASNGTLSCKASGTAVGFSVGCELLLSGITASALSVGGTVSTTSGNASAGLTGTVSVDVDGGLLITCVAVTLGGVCSEVSRIGVLVGANLIVRIDRIVVVRGCPVIIVGVAELAGTDNLVVTVTILTGVDFLTEEVTIRIGSAATIGTANRRVMMPQITRRRDLSRWCNNCVSAVVSGRLVRAVIWCFVRNGNVMGMTLTCACSCHANKSCFSA